MENKERIVKKVDELRDILVWLGDEIHRNPEPGNKEFKAVELLTDQLAKHGFTVERGSADFQLLLKLFTAVKVKDLL